jgi:hypothetical protein
MTATWPIAELNAVQRLHVLASATGATYATTTAHAPIEQVWAVIEDLEHELPHLLPDVRRFVITSRDQDRLQGEATGYLGLRARFEVVLRPGWCVMQSRRLLGGFAATTTIDGTEVAFLSRLRVPGRSVLAPILDPLAASLAKRVLERLEARVGP